MRLWHLLLVQAVKAHTSLHKNAVSLLREPSLLAHIKNLEEGT